MLACPDDNTVAQLAEGGLSATERAALEAHLDTCATCSALLENLAQLVAPERTAPARYRIIAQLGAGAMGEVWEAEDLQLARRVALKFISPEKSDDVDRRNRLLREARALAQVRHANVLAVHDVGSMTSHDELYVALEIVDGGNARQWRDAAPRTDAEVLALWKQAGTGLAAVHAAGLVHRDVKPDNVLVATDGRVVLGDFGLARGESNLVLETLTHSDVTVGTPQYMAPEQLLGEPATARSDQFAWCVAVWEALYGVRPFVGKTTGALTLAMQTPPVLPTGANPAVFEVLARGLLPQPEARWPTMQVLLDALDAAAGAASVRAPASRRWPLVAGGALVIASTVGIVAFAQRASAPHGNDAAAVVPVDAVTATDALRSTPSVVVPTAAAVAAHAIDANRVRALRTQDAAAAVAATDWHDVVNHATALLGSRRGADCLAELQQLPAELPPRAIDEVAGLRLRCTLLDTACSAGPAVITAFAQAHQWPPAALEARLREFDLASCPIDALPIERAAARAKYQLALAVSARQPCKPLAQTIQQLRIAETADVRFVALAAACFVRGNDCTGALAAFDQLYVGAGIGPDAAAASIAAAKSSFLRGNPGCQQPAPPAP